MDWNEISFRTHLPSGWCRVHLATRESSTDKYCYWDRVIGPRPGRGTCIFVPATIVWIDPDYTPGEEPTIS